MNDYRNITKVKLHRLDGTTDERPVAWPSEIESLVAAAMEHGWPAWTFESTLDVYERPAK